MLLKKINKSEPGQIIILTLVILAVCSLIIGPLLSHMSTGIKTTSQVYDVNTSDQYAADAGVAKAMWYIKYQSEDVPSNFTINNINGKNVSVNISYITNPDETVTYEISSYAGLITTNANVVFTPEVQEVPPVPPVQAVSYFSNAVSTGIGGDINLSGAAKICSDNGKNGDVFSGANLNLEGSSMVEGDVYTRSDISLGWSTKIDGNAVASGSIGTLGTITGTRESGASQQTPPSIPSADLNDMVQNIYDETYNIGSISPGGTTYSGDLTIKNQNGVHYPQIYVMGDLLFKNVNTNVVFDGQVYVTGDIYFSGVQNLTFNGSVYAGGQVYTGSGSGQVAFQNKIICGSVDLGGAFAFTFYGSVKDMGDFTVGNSVVTFFGSTIYVGGNFYYSGASNLNISHNMYIKGAMTFGNSAQIVGPQKVVVRGNVTLSGASQLSASQIPYIIVPPAAATPPLSPMANPSSVTLANSAVSSAAVYAPTADFTASGATKLVGAIVAKTITLSNSAQVEYITGLSEREDLKSPGIPGDPGSPGVPASWDLSTWNIQ